MSAATTFKECNGLCVKCADFSITCCAVLDINARTKVTSCFISTENVFSNASNFLERSA